MYYGDDDYTEDDYNTEREAPLAGNHAELTDALVGRKIVKVETDVKDDEYSYSYGEATVLTLDNDVQVRIRDTSDCCAYTEMENVIQHLPELDHVITNVTADDGYERFHIFADLGEVLELQLSWSEGNPFYYGYGFYIDVTTTEDV